MPPPTIAGHVYQPAFPSRAYTAMPIGGWLVYPTFFGGALYDSNPNQAPSGNNGTAGFRFVPSVLAETENGIEKTTLYGTADGRVYTNPGTGINSVDTVAANAGMIEKYQPLPDLAFRAQGDYLRQKDLFSTLGITPGVTYLNPTGIGLSPTIQPLSYNQFTGTVSVQKTFYRAFASLDGSVVGIVYDRFSGLPPSPNGITYTGTARGGFWITPFLFTYAEGSLDERSQSTSALSSSGFRTVAGIGTSRIRLVRGEVYAGYEQEAYRAAGIGTVNSLVLGGRGYYYPTPSLTLEASVDEALGASLLVPTAVSLVGTATQVTTALAKATYSFGPEWLASGRGGYIHTDYVNSFRRDDGWTVGGTVTYSIWRNIGLTLDYQHLELSSNIPFQSFSRNVITIGGTYKF